MGVRESHWLWSKRNEKFKAFIWNLPVDWSLGIHAVLEQAEEDGFPKPSYAGWTKSWSVDDFRTPIQEKDPAEVQAVKAVVEMPQPKPTVTLEFIPARVIGMTPRSPYAITCF